MDHVLPEEKFVLDDVTNEGAEEHNVAARTDRHPDVGQSARAREPWIDVNDGCTALLCFHHPAKTDRVRFRHRRTLYYYTIGVGEILLRGRSSATAERGAQTGHRAAMSYPGLVGHTDHAQACGEKFLDEIIFFVIKRSAAEMTNRGCLVYRRTIFLAHERALA